MYVSWKIIYKFKMVYFDKRQFESHLTIDFLPHVIFGN